jgi:ABC-type dipeptide/oligopeptide/nickel transport system permease subunit
VLSCYREKVLSVYSYILVSFMRRLILLCIIIEQNPICTMLTNLIESSGGGAFVSCYFRHIKDILAEAGLSFLGIGVVPPTSTWGNMISGGRQYLSTNPLLSLAPGFMVMLVVLCL